MAELTPKNHPSFQLTDPDYSWDKIPKNSWEIPHQKMQVPDWRIYKIEGIHELEYIRDTLASKGLKDPWLRNEVWRYPPFYERNPIVSYRKFLFGIKFRGVKYGLTATVVLCSLEYLYYKKRYGDYPPHITTLYHLFNPRHHH